MKILITGSSGLIGEDIYKKLKSSKNELIGIDIIKSETTQEVIDISNRKDLGNLLIKIKPNIIVHAGAIKSLQECEKDKVKSWNINVESTAEIVQYAKKNICKVIYISSDVIFDGTKGDYDIDDLPNPINWYGTTKYHSELLISELENYAICRTALVLSKLNTNLKKQLDIEVNNEILNNQSVLPHYIYYRLQDNKKVLLPRDIISSPTDKELISNSISKIIDNNLFGIFNTVGSESISRFDFALKIAEKFGFDKNLILPDNSKILEIRPKNLSMQHTESYKKLGLYSKDWDVESVLNKILS